MEGWQNGRQEFVDEMLRVYDKIGANAATGLDHDKSILIDREKLRALREKANRVDELEDEVSNLALQKRAQDLRPNDARLLQEKTAETERLAEENTRLKEDLGRYVGFPSRVEELEQENRRLSGELQQSLQRLQDAENEEVNESRASPGATDISSSVRKIEHEGTEPVAVEVYLSLIAKYNSLAQNWRDLKAVRNKLEVAVRKEKEKGRKWVSHADMKDKLLKRKEEKIRQLEQEIRTLKGLPDPGPTTPRSSGPVSGRNAVNDNTEMSSFGKGGHVQVDQFISPGDVIRDLSSSAPKETVPIPPPVQVSMSSPVRQFPLQNPGSVCQTTEAETELDSPGLPMLLGPDGEGSVDDTQFEMIGPHHSSSTEGDPEPNALERADRHNTTDAEPRIDLPSSPAPVVISARCVRKRKGRKDTLQSPVTRIKVETISSSPIGLAAFHGLDPNESIDLDEIGDKQATPKKKKLQPNQTARSFSRILNSGRRYRSVGLDPGHPSFEQESGGRSQSVPFAEVLADPRGSPLQPLSTNRQILPRTSDERAPKRRRVASDQALEELLEDGPMVGSANSNRTKYPGPSFAQRLGDLLDKPSPLKTAITPVSQLGGLRLFTTTKADVSASRMYEPDPADGFHGQRYQGNATCEKPSRFSNRTSAATPHRAIEQSRPSSKGSTRGFNEKTRPSSKEASKGPTSGSRSTSRDLIERPRSSSKGASRDPACGSRPTSRDSPAVDYLTPSQKILELPATRKMPWDANGKPLKDPAHNFITPTRPPPKKAAKQTATTGRMTVSKRISRAAEEVFNAEVDHPKNEPLRSRPLHKLDPEDFKVNPNYNQGYKHAFNEVVRNKDDRKCLQGCTKTDCCGDKWRALAKEELANYGHHPTSSQEEKETTLLEEFMGDNIYKLRNMTSSERFEMLIQAKTRDLANKLGRHRHAYERRSSPPGFWRFEFPNTQERKEDAEKAEAQRRELVRMRYEEAMRPGGRFLFRDE